MNTTSERDQTKLDVLLSNIHGYPRNPHGLFDAIPFIRLKGTSMKLKLTFDIHYLYKASNSKIIFINCINVEIKKKLRQL